MNQPTDVRGLARIPFIRACLFSLLVAIPCVAQSVITFSYRGTPGYFTGSGNDEWNFFTNTFSNYDMGAQCDYSICSFQLIGWTRTPTPSGYMNIVAVYQSGDLKAPCPADTPPVPPCCAQIPRNDRTDNALREAVRARFASGVTFFYKDSNDDFLNTSVKRYETSNWFKFYCTARTTTGGTRQIGAVFIINSVFDGVAPGARPSVCTFVGSNLSISFESLSTSVATVKSVPLSVVCGTGEPVNYKLSLSSALAANGQLSFGNGIYASVSVDGSPLQANGDWIRLVGLSSGTKNMTVTLSGTASSTGVSDATGILLLEML